MWSLDLDFGLFGIVPVYVALEKLLFFDCIELKIAYQAVSGAHRDDSDTSISVEAIEVWDPVMCHG